MKPHKLLSALLLSPLLTPLPAAATGDGSDGAAVRAARDFLYQRSRNLGDEVRVEVQTPATRMPTCDSPRPFLPGKRQNRWGRITVGLRCGTRGRVHYLQARVTVIGDYWVAAARIDAGAPISAKMLTRTRGDLGELPRGAVLERAKILGRVASRPLAAGTVLQDHQLHQPSLVQRRQALAVEARGRGFRVAREGVALESGAMGETVRVRMQDRSVLSAVITGPGRAEVRF